MTNQTVPFGDNARDRAVALLAAAEDLELPVHVVETRTDAFSAPAEVVEKAGLSDKVLTDESSLSEDSDADTDRTPAKKAAAKKTAATAPGKEK